MKRELLDQVWPDTYVGDAVLKVCIGEIRKSLDDEPRNPRFIETSHRKGYRFIGPVLEVATEPPAATASSFLVGRDAAQARLGEWLSGALDGRRHVIFITGDPGAGKSTLSETFLQHLPPGVLVARGHALEQYGSGEAYLPVLEALTSLCREDSDARVVRLLETHAPTWLAQMPSLAAAGGRAALQREVIGATRERMLREMAECIEALTADVPLILLLEDLHWSDTSTLDLISYLARRRGSARLMLIGTYRPVEVILSQHPLKAVKRELQLHDMCHELPLDFLSEVDVREYLDRRFPPNDFEPALAHSIHSRTDGNPLFMAQEIDFLEKSGSITAHNGCWRLAIPVEQVEGEMPESLRALIERQIERSSPEEQSLLQVASIVGTEFSVSAVSFGLDLDMAAVEEVCEALARRGLFIRRRGVIDLPEGVASQYEFIHSLYQNVLYDLVPLGKRLRLHCRIGEGLETLYGAHSSTIAAELAPHFEEGRDYVRAAKYLFLAAETASRRYAYREAVAYLKKARDLIGRLPQEERDDLELAALEQLGLARRSMGDMRQAAYEFDSMVTLAKNGNRFDTAVRALLYRSSALSWFDRNECLNAAEQALHLSGQTQDEMLRAHAQGYCAYWRFLYTGWQDEDLLWSRKAIEAAERNGRQDLLSLHVGRHSYFQCMRSNYEEAIRTADRGIVLAIEVGDFFDHSMSQFFKGWALLHAGRWHELLRLVEEAGHLAERNEHYLWKTLFDLELAWLHQQCGSLAEAETLCRKALDHARNGGHEYTQMLASTLLGLVLLDQSNVEGGLNCLQGVAAMTSEKRVLMDWIWEVPLRLGLANAWLRQRNYKNATQNAQRALKTAQQPREKTYMALASAMLAEISYSEGNLILATEHSATAINLVETAAIPLAAERVYLVAAQIHRLHGKLEAANEYVNHATEARAQLARSLETAPSLRESLLRARPETLSFQKGCSA